MSNFLDLEGKKLGRLFVIETASSDRNGIKWLCKCDCGNYTIALSRSLAKGTTTSCGCYGKEQRAKASKKHGHSGRSNADTTPTYKTWSSMKRRCKDKNHCNHASYYDKGIKVCERWEDFTNFLEDMGERPEGKTLDRIDGDKGYYKENCKWSTPKEQANNMNRNHFLEFNGEKLTISQWADKIGVKYVTLNTRIHRGWSVERALTTK